MDELEPTFSKPAKTRCKNCNKKLPKKGAFCPGCGQRDFDGRVRMRDLLAKFFANFTHLDGKFVKMCWHLLVPARVSMHYFEGKIRRYPHPVQFFFIVIFFFLLMFSKQMGNVGFNSVGGDFSLHVNGGDTLQNMEAEKLLVEAGFIGVLERANHAKKYRAAFDSLPIDWRTPIVRQSLDTVVQLVDGPWERTARFALNMDKNGENKGPEDKDSVAINFIFTSVKVSTEDLVGLSPDSIIARYDLKAWDEKIAIRQGIKSIKDPKGLISRYVGSFGWAILVLIALMSLVLHLLYWTRKRYYVEHFIFLMHQQSGAFLLLTIALFLQTYLFALGIVWPLLFLWIGISLLLAMKRFYQNGWGWTLVKWLIFCAAYLAGLLVLFVATLLVVFLIF